MSDTAETQRLDRIEMRQEQTDAKLGDLISAVSTLAESHRLAQEEQTRERQQYRADHKATHDAIQRLSSSTVEAIGNLRDRIGQAREGNPAQVRWAVGMAWVVSVVLVGWGARQYAMNLVHEAKIVASESYIRDTVLPRFVENESDIERIEKKTNDRYSGTQGHALEQRVARLEALREAGSE